MKTGDLVMVKNGRHSGRVGVLLGPSHDGVMVQFIGSAGEKLGQCITSLNLLDSETHPAWLDAHKNYLLRKGK